MTAIAGTRPIVICPLEHERRALHRAGVRGWCELHRTGPGAAGVERWWMRFQPRAGSVVILAGVAGALSPELEAGSCSWVSRVRDVRSGTDWSASVCFGSKNRPAQTVISTESTVTSVAEKQQLRAATGADLVDLESLRFAQLAVGEGVRWGILRAVSDDAGSALPVEIDQWVDEHGRTRASQVALALLRRPQLLREVIPLARATARGLAQAARELQANQTAITAAAQAQTSINAR